MHTGNCLNEASEVKEVNEEKICLRLRRRFFRFFGSFVCFVNSFAVSIQKREEPSESGIHI